MTALLADPHARLVTMLAPGGMGKTRLALEAARLQLGQFADGVFFVALAPLTTAADVVFAIAEQVGQLLHGQAPPEQQLLAFLAPRSLLLLLDNCEHLLEAAPTVSELLRAAPGVRVLATSRERLGLQGETVYILRGLDFQAWEHAADIEQSAAGALFLQCAQRVYPDFKLQAGDMEHLARICHLTAGMPLALELAAGWTGVLPLAQIATELQRGIDILQTELRDVPDRHRSIRATFDLTWQQLNDDERAVFMRLSVFSGGFTREAAAAVAGADRNHLRSFSSKALIEIVEGDRYDIHELLCQFGAEKLAAAGAEAGTKAQHAAYFAAFMAECWGGIRTNRQLEALERVAADFENVRAAWLYTLHQGNWEQLASFLDSLRFYCQVRAPAQLAVDLFEHAVQVVRAAPATPANEVMAARLLARLSWFYCRVGSADRCMASSDEAIGILRRYGSTYDLVVALYSYHVGVLMVYEADLGARAAQEGISLARSLGDQHWEGRFLTHIAIYHYIRNDDRSARRRAEEALAIFEGLGDRWSSMRCYGLLGQIEESQENYVQAVFRFQQALSLSQAFGYHLNSGASMTHLARLAFYAGDVPGACRYLCEALRTAWHNGHHWLSAFPLVVAAQMLAAQKRPVRAVEILGAVHRHLTPFHRTDQAARSLRDELASRLPAHEFAGAWAYGQGRDVGHLLQELLLEFAESAESGVPPMEGI